ncbi:MAG: maleylacetate reductase [Solirubrobacteraceae bacterium]|jgi:alcohol dehydrogenase class IV|nr:maleylacetate reductase [Solirubrobacteraceae bacterium]
MSEAFRHVDRERTIVFGAGALGDAGELLGDGYTLLTTPRAVSSAPDLAKRAAAVVHVPAGLVDVVAADLRPGVTGDKLVALGGGRVIDVAKALAAADGPRAVAAIPTSLSGAEMTGVHRHARGIADSTPKVRPSLVVNDPELSASQPVDQLAASSANALGHAITALVSERSTAIARAVAAEAITTLAAGWSDGEPDRSRVALGALLAGWAVDHSGLGPHHALAQTAVRVASLQHAHANTALLPFTLAAMRARDPAAFERLDLALARPVEAFAVELGRRADVAGLGELGADAELLNRTVAAAVKRAELARVTPALEHDEVLAIYRRAAGASDRRLQDPQQLAD